MRLTLRLDNVDYREDGGPLDYVSEGRDFIVGRHSRADWSLPDPSKTISRSHFEIRFDATGAWLHDLSMTGTFVVGESHRVVSPRLLRSGERLRVGGLILAVQIDAAAATAMPTLPGDTAALRGWTVVPVAQTPAPDRPVADRPVAGHSPVNGPAPPGWGTTTGWPMPEGTAPPAAVAQTAPPPPMPAFPPAAPPRGGEGWRDGVCAGMGLPPGALEAVDPQMLGRLLAGMTDDLMGLLAARAIIKRNVRSKTRTVIAPLENNPLKFRANVAEALESMFARPSAGFLGPEAAYRAGFADLRQHETAMVAALQPALARLLEDLAPEAIEQRAEAGLFANRKARAWEVFVERWDAKTHPYENGMLDLFLTYFAEAYDQAAGQQTAPPTGQS